MTNTDTPLVYKRVLLKLSGEALMGDEAFGFDTRVKGMGYFYGAGEYTVIAVDPWTSSFYSKESIFEELERMGNTPGK